MFARPEIGKHKRLPGSDPGYAENVVCCPFIEFSKGPTRTLDGG
jgi:hypothetical protein